MKLRIEAEVPPGECLTAGEGAEPNLELTEEAAGSPAAEQTGMIPLPVLLQAWEGAGWVSPARTPVTAHLRERAAPLEEHTCRLGLRRQAPDSNRIEEERNLPASKTGAARSPSESRTQERVAAEVAASARTVSQHAIKIKTANDAPEKEGNRYSRPRFAESSPIHSIVLPP